MSYQNSDGGHEMGAGEEDGPGESVALVALGATTDVANAADVADVAISVQVLLNYSVPFILFTELVSERCRRSGIQTKYTAVNMGILRKTAINVSRLENAKKSSQGQD